MADLVSGQTIRNSHSASALHARLQMGTRAARDTGGRTATPPRKPRRVRDRDVWQVVNQLRGSGSLAEPTLSCDRALRRILSALIESPMHDVQPVRLEAYSDPVLIVRSGPWPLLRALLVKRSQMSQVSTAGSIPPVTLLCHRRDSGAVEDLAQAVGQAIHPLYYPKFEPFNPATLQRVIQSARGPWAATFVLDASRTGRGQGLEHITTALTQNPGERYVWNASGQLFRLHTLRDTLGREEYEIVRRLLRWRAARNAAD
jgi:hypothetical protein